MPARTTKAARQDAEPKPAGTPDPQPGARTFEAVLEPDHSSLKWTVARIPFRSSAAWPDMIRRRVAGTVNGHAFRTSLFPAPGRAAAEMLIVNKQMQAAAGVRLGDRAHFVLWPDLAERPAELPPELLATFQGDKTLLRWTGSLSESNRREIGRWIYGVKSPESRLGRARHMAERLLLAMEGERETPPLLEALLRAQPKARAGWLAWTPHQRRGHLLGIFYYRTPEGRTRRAQKAVAEALRAASDAPVRRED